MSLFQNVNFSAFDFNTIKGFLGLAMPSTGLIFVIHGFTYKAEAYKWENAATSNTVWYLNEASNWHTSAMWMFIIASLLICGGFFLLVMNYRSLKRPEEE